MLDIVLKIITVISIVLLFLLGLIVVLLLLVLFFPISYRMKGEKVAETLTLTVKLDWLWGFIRGRYFYPEPGKVVVKLLWFTLYDSSTPAKTEKSKTEDGEEAKGKMQKSSGLPYEKQAVNQENTSSNATECSMQQQKENLETKPNSETQRDSEQKPEKEPEPDLKEEKGKGLIAFVTAKYEKIKYTISKIYDTIKHILDNIKFYRDLFQEEETQALLKHGIERLKKILKNIRPRKLKGNLVFGTGSPDTTGYILGVCGIISPMYNGYINITPDFEQTVLLGDFYMAGHITLFQVLFHSLMLIFDKRLKHLNAKIKKHRIQNS